MISSSRIGIIATVVIVALSVGVAVNGNSFPTSVSAEIKKIDKDITSIESKILAPPAEKVMPGTDPFANIAAKVMAKNPSLDELKQQEHATQSKIISEEKMQERQFKESLQQYKWFEEETISLIILVKSMNREDIFYYYKNLRN